MFRAWLVVAVFCCGTASAANPSYSAAGVVNASSFTGGPFAPNSVVSIFGSNLARSTHALGPDDITLKGLPLEMNFVRVYVDNQQMPILFVSEGQINFLMNNLLKPGPAVIRVVNEGNTGPEMTVNVVDCAPALFALDGGWAIATNATGKLLTPDAPAHTGDFIVVYLTGLGRTSAKLDVGVIPPLADQILSLATLKVTLGNVTVPRDLIKYAGVTPGSGGLYQINLVVPEGAGTDPEIKVTGDTTSGGLKLPVR